MSARDFQGQFSSGTAAFYRAGLAPEGSRLSVPYVDILARRARSGDRVAYLELIAGVRWIAEAAAWKGYITHSCYLDRDDLRQEAMVGIISGLQIWDPAKSSFRTYAYSRARFAVMDAVHDAPLFHMSRNMADAARQVLAGKRTTESAARYVGTSPENIAQGVLRLTHGHVQSANPSDDANEETYGMREFDEELERAARRLDLVRSLRRGRRRLTDREARILDGIYGLSGEKKTYEMLAREMGVSNQRINNLRAKALEKLRIANTTGGCS